MTTLKEQIAHYDAQKAQKVPKEILDTMQKATLALQIENLEENALKSGDIMPNFTLKNHLQKERKFYDYLAKTPVVLSFYRGGWCPYCNLELNALQASLPLIRSLGSDLVAISPETPDNSLSTKEKNGLLFDILFDKDNLLAKALGLAFELPDSLKEIYESFGIDIPGQNGNNSYLIPMPATYIVDQNARILYHFIDADYTKRAEPAEILKNLKKFFG
jgi:peroxiredoxin